MKLNKFQPISSINFIKNQLIDSIQIPLKLNFNSIKSVKSYFILTTHCLGIRQFLVSSVMDIVHCVVAPAVLFYGSEDLRRKGRRFVEKMLNIALSR